MNPWKEAEIIINDIDVGLGCVLTIRVALEVFAKELTENGLGEDELGKCMVRNYLNRIQDLRIAMKVIK
jgi:hypothetical protein